MVDLRAGTSAVGPPGTTAGYERPEFIEWLRTGRLTLVGKDKEPVDVEGWTSLPAEARRRVMSEFDRVVRAGTKAAVLFVK